MGIKPYIIGIAGPSCGGKTTISQLLGKILTPERAVLFPMDNYYLDFEELVAQTNQMNIFLRKPVMPEQPVGTASINFDMPTALDSALIFEHISILANGGEIDCPVYSFENHCRVKGEFEHLVAKEFLIVEGLFTLYWDHVRNLCRTKVFIECTEEVCLKRRLYRDVHFRGRSVTSVRDQFYMTVKPMYDMYGKRTRRLADVKINGEDDTGISIRTILKYIAKDMKLPGLRLLGQECQR